MAGRWGCCRHLGIPRDHHLRLDPKWGPRSQGMRGTKPLQPLLLLRYPSRCCLQAEKYLAEARGDTARGKANAQRVELASHSSR